MTAQGHAAGGAARAIGPELGPELGVDTDAERAGGRPSSPLAGLALGARHLDRVILRLAQGVGLVALIALFAAISTGVALRYLSNGGSGWVNELPYLLFPWTNAAAFVIAAQYGAHILVEALLVALPYRAGRWLIAAGHLGAVVLFLYLSKVGLLLIEVTSAESYPVLGISTAWAYGALVAACLMLALTALTGIPRVLAHAGDPLRARLPDHETGGVA